MDNLETQATMGVLQKPIDAKPSDLENPNLYTGTSTLLLTGAFIFVLYYLGKRNLYITEKRKNIVNGDYARLFLDEKKCQRYHRIFLLGKPSDFIRDYVRKHPEELE